MIKAHAKPSAPGTEQETLEAVESFLREHRRTLTFPDWLERILEAETRKRHTSEPLVEKLKPIALYNVFMIADVLLAPDTLWLSAMLHFLLVTPAMLYVAVLFRRRIEPLTRDIAGAAIPILMTFQILAVFVVSRAPMVEHYPYFVLMTAICTNVAMRLRNRAAHWATLSIFFMLVGTLLITQKIPGAIATTQCISLGMCGLVTLGANFRIERDFRRAFLQNLRDRLRVAITDAEARHDVLTGAVNRRGLDEAAAELWRDEEATTPVSVILFDIDRFKNYNDIYGHQAGDLCLKRVAASVAAELRSRGFALARYGGEEFLAILPQIDGREAREIAERLRRAVVALAIRHSGSGDLGFVSASFGVATAKLGETTFEALVFAADSALYAAKRNGRNQVAGGPAAREAA
jgi:diguanylate cyclase (GGDEF)-like protein